jgi:long-chain acyl-CoA synthetase
MDTASSVARRLADLPIDRHLAVLPLSLLLENTAGIYAPLLRGAEILCSRSAGPGLARHVRVRASRTAARGGAAAPSSLILVPELLKLWALFLAASGQAGPASLCYVAVGGARVSPALLLRARTQGLPAYEGYG